MSAPGQQIDPLMALASQPATAVDPLAQLASGQLIAASPQVQPQVSSGGWASPTGTISAAVRNATNAATFNLADPAAAAIGAAFPVQGWTSTLPTYGERFNQLLQMSRGATNQGQKSHPYISLAGSVAGGALNPVTAVMGPPASLGGAIAQGAGMGAAYGAGGSIGNSPDLTDAAKQTLLGGALGGMAGTATYGLGKILSGATRSPEAQTLVDQGVPLTMGQGLGGSAQTIEDATTHIPMLGNAIKARQADAITGFNRAIYNNVLEPLGVQYGEDGPIGNEGVSRLGSLIGNAYDKAYNGATVLKSPSVMSDVDSATDQASNLLPSDKVSQIQANINRLITGKFDENGVLNSNDLQTAKNFFSEQSRASPTASLEDRATASAYGKVADALKQGIGETDPDRAALLNAADSAYSRLVRVQQAAGTNAASGKGGIFTASQLGNALRSMDNSVRRTNFATGTVPMQNLAQAGQAVLPSTVPDSGTALRGLLELGAGGILTHEVSPEATLGAAGLIGGGTALYSKPGQALANALLFGGGGARKAMGAIPMKLLPGVIAGAQLSGGQP